MIKKTILRQVILSVGTILFLALAWYALFQQKNNLTKTTMAAYQQAEMEIVHSVAHNIELYVSHEIEHHGQIDDFEIKQDVFENFIKPIHLLENGEAWFYTPNYVVFDPSGEFPDEYHEKSIADIFAIQELNGASHFSEMVASVREASEGVGSYIWSPERGEEVAAWYPIKTEGYVWVVGISTPLSEILETTGAAQHFRLLDILGIIGTISIITMTVIWELSMLRSLKTDKALKEKEVRYRRLFDSAPDGVAVLDKETTILDCSQSLADLYGYANPNELIGKKMTELMSQDSLKVFKEQFQFLKMLKTGEGEIEILKSDGSLLHIWRKGHPIVDENGEFSEILSYDRDISDRVQIEKSLKNEREQLLSVFDSIEEIIYVSDPETYEILYTNQAIKNSLGRNPTGELCYRAFQGFDSPCEFCTNPIILKNKEDAYRWKYHNPILQKDYDIIDRIIKWSDGRDVRFELAIDITGQVSAEKLLRKAHDELEMHVAERTKELADANQTLQIEIIERKQVEEALKAAKQLSENLIETANTIIITLDTKANIKIFNRHAEELTGYKKSEVIGKNWFDIFIPQRDRKNMIDFFNVSLENAREASLKENYILLKNNEERLISWRNNTMFSDLGDVRGLLSIGTDITEQKKMEKELHRQAITDPLTQIFNRRHFFNIAQQELDRSQRYKRPLSVITFDIDHFKKINDTYGHGAGDDVLRKITKECQNNLRENDIFARYGGEEFIVLLPETDLEQAEQLAERMRKVRAETPLDIGLATVELTMSFGVAHFNEAKMALDELLLRADNALYKAKETGRNRVCIWGAYDVD